MSKLKQDSLFVESAAPAKVAASKVASKTILELHLGDCVAGMKAIPEATVDVVVTSPPYNLGIAYSKYDDTQSREHYLEWSLQWAAEVKRVLKPAASFILNVVPLPPIRCCRTNWRLNFPKSLSCKTPFTGSSPFPWRRARARNFPSATSSPSIQNAS